MIRTVVSFEDDQYHALKEEAFKRRKSLSAVVRDLADEKFSKRAQKPSKAEVDAFMARIRKHAKESAKYLKGWDSLKALRGIRDEN